MSARLAPLVTIHVQTQAHATFTEKSLHALLCDQFRSNTSYVASLESDNVKIFNSKTWNLVQTIPGKASLFHFLNKNDAIVGVDTVIKVWSIRHQLFMKTMYTTIDCGEASYFREGTLIIHVDSQIDALNTSTGVLYTKELEHSIEHVCIRNQQLITAHANNFLYVWTLSLEPIRTIKTPLQVVSYISPWFEDKLLLTDSRNTTVIIFDCNTETVCQEIDREIALTRQFGDKFVVKENLGPISVWTRDLESVNIVAIPSNASFYFYNPFSVLGKQLLYVPMHEVGHSILVYDLDTLEMVQEVKTNSLQVFT
jgi:WD40 repeat protein